MTAGLLQSLPTMSLAISIVVIICMAISFAVLFFLYGKSKARGVSFGVEDKQIREELTKKLERCGGGVTCSQMLEKSKKREKTVRIFTDVILLILIALVGALTVFSIVLRSKGEQVYFGDTAYITVLTSSMQEKNEDNEFLKEHDDGVRIHQYALIGIDKVNPDDLKEGDIIAFRYEGSTVYIHRIVAIGELNGERVFTTMGDGNSSSLMNEINISADRIVGVFNGYHKGYLGVILIYMRSDIGMVALIFVFLLLAVIDFSEWYITRSYEKRQRTLASQMDGGANADGGQEFFAPENGGGNAAKPQEERRNDYDDGGFNDPVNPADYGLSPDSFYGNSLDNKPAEDYGGYSDSYGGGYGGYSDDYDDGYGGYSGGYDDYDDYSDRYDDYGVDVAEGDDDD